MYARRFIPLAFATMVSTSYASPPLFIEDMPDHIENKGYTFQGFGIRFGAINVMSLDETKVDRIDFTRAYIEDTLMRDKGIDPRKILAIFDVDGTLLKDPHPMHGKEPILREGAMETIQRLQQLGVNVVASSAWSNPQDTYERLKRAGFTEALQLQEDPIFDRDPTNRYFVSKTGLIASVKNMNVDPRYYRQKAFAPKYLMPDKITTFTHVVFTEDSLCNFQCFYKDVLSAKELYATGTEFAFMHLNPQEKS